MSHYKNSLYAPDGAHLGGGLHPIYSNRTFSDATQAVDWFLDPLPVLRAGEVIDTMLGGERSRTTLPPAIETLGIEVNAQFDSACLPIALRF